MLLKQKTKGHKWKSFSSRRRKFLFKHFLTFDSCSTLTGGETGITAFIFGSSADAATPQAGELLHQPNQAGDVLDGFYVRESVCEHHKCVCVSGGIINASKTHFLISNGDSKGHVTHPIWKQNKQFWFCLQGFVGMTPPPSPPPPTSLDQLVELSRPQFKKRCITKFVVMSTHTACLELDWFYWNLIGSGTVGNNSKSSERRESTERAAMDTRVQLYPDAFSKFIFCFHQINCLGAHAHTHTHL